MSRECPKCGFELRDATWTEKFVLEKLQRFEKVNGCDTETGLDIWGEARPGTKLMVPELDSEFELIESSTSFSFEEAESMCYVVLHSPTWGYFKAVGYRDSYGGYHWDDSEFRQVTQQTRTTWVWED